MLSKRLLCWNVADTTVGKAGRECEWERASGFYIQTQLAKELGGISEEHRRTEP